LAKKEELTAAAFGAAPMCRWCRANESRGLYLLAYGLEGALLLVFGAVDSKQSGVAGVGGKVFRTRPLLLYFLNLEGK
jgi:hypothetical protein